MVVTPGRMQICSTAHDVMDLLDILEARDTTEEGASIGG
jgi:hypothetical protein